HWPTRPCTTAGGASSLSTAVGSVVVSSKTGSACGRRASVIWAWNSAAPCTTSGYVSYPGSRWFNRDKLKYYVVKIDDHTIKLAATGANAAANTTIDIVKPAAAAANADPNRYALIVIGTSVDFPAADTTITTNSPSNPAQLQNTI